MLKGSNDSSLDIQVDRRSPRFPWIVVGIVFAICINAGIVLLVVVYVIAFGRGLGATGAAPLPGPFEQYTAWILLIPFGHIVQKLRLHEGWLFLALPADIIVLSAAVALMLGGVHFGIKHIFRSVPNQ